MKINIAVLLIFMGLACKVSHAGAETWGEWFSRQWNTAKQQPVMVYEALRDLPQNLTVVAEDVKKKAHRATNSTN